MAAVGNLGGVIGDSNEALYLFDADCNLEDMVQASPNWPAGDSSRSMERFDIWNWYTSQGSTPGEANSPAPAILSHPPAEPESEEIASYPKLLINEIQIKPIENRFIELYNPNNEEVNLTGWYIQRKTKTGSNWESFVSSSKLEGKNIQPKSYFLIARSTTTNPDILLEDLTLTKNNTLILKNPNRDIVDKVGWGDEAQDYELSPATNPPKDKSIGRIDGVDTNNNQEDFEVQNPTPKALNESPEEEGGGGESEGESTSTAAVAGSVVINEIAWMGTDANSADEWIELYNNTTSSIDFTGWKLVSSDNKPNINFSGPGAATTTIPGEGFYLIERTADDTVSDVVADWVGSFGNGKGMGLGNNPNCEILSLYDKNNNLIDQTPCLENGNWPAGDNDTKQTMERIDTVAVGTSTDNWASNNRITRNGLDAGNHKINGTPKAENSVSLSSTTVASLPFDEFSEVVLTYLGSPYIVNTNNLTVPQNKILKIEPGVEIKFKTMCHGGYGGCQKDNLRIEGTLLAEGESEKEIIFTSFLTPQGNQNWWSKIYFTPSSRDSKLDYVRIKYGGQDNGKYKYDGKKISGSFVIYVDGSSISLQNSVIENFNVDGIALVDSTSTIENVTIKETTAGRAMRISGGKPEIKNSTFKNTLRGILVEDGSQAEIKNNYFEGIKGAAIAVEDSWPVFGGNSGQDNDTNGIKLAGIVSQDWHLVLNDASFPYFVGSLTTASSTLFQIDPGVEIKLMGTGSKIIVKGRLEALGESDNKIIFTSSDSSSWDRIEFNSTEATSTLKYVEINQGGTPTEGDDYGMLHVTGGAADLQDLILQKAYVGINIIGQCPLMENLNFIDVTYPYSRNGNFTTSTSPALICQ